MCASQAWAAKRPNQGLQQTAATMLASRVSRLSARPPLLSRAVRPKRTHRAQINAGLDYAAAIIEDRIGVLSYYSGGKFSGSRSVDLPSPETLPKLYEGMGLISSLPELCQDCTKRRANSAGA